MRRSCVPDRTSGTVRILRAETDGASGSLRCTMSTATSHKGRALVLARSVEEIGPGIPPRTDAQDHRRLLTWYVGPCRRRDSLWCQYVLPLDRITAAPLKPRPNASLARWAKRKSKKAPSLPKLPGWTE
jgi:hypothetical protein